MCLVSGTHYTNREVLHFNFLCYQQLPPRNASEGINQFIENEMVDAIALGQVSVVLMNLTNATMDDEDVIEAICVLHFRQSHTF